MSFAQDSHSRAAEFRKLVAAAPRLSVKSTALRVEAPSPDWELDFVSSLAMDGKGTIYLFQRGLKADPVLAVDRAGVILRSWGRGLYKIPHSIRVDPKGNIWTVDAASSMVHRFTPDGKQLLEIDVGGLPEKPKSPFCGTTDIAFLGDRIFISDGYANARVLEYRMDGRRVREWGRRGTGPGEFNLPHAIAAGPDGSIYVADRENGRIQWFSPEGRHRGEWNHLGRTFSLKFAANGDIWMGSQPHDTANGVECWLLRVDRRTGKLLGAIPSGGHHSIELSLAGEPMTGARPNHVLWFRAE